MAPDVVVPESQALDVAHQQVLERLLDAAATDDERYRFRWALDGVRARVSPVRPDARTLAGYAGTYGRRQILFEGGVLYDQREDRPKQAMIPLGPDFFAVHGLETQRLRFTREGGSVTGLTVLGRSGSSQTVPRVTGLAPARK